MQELISLIESYLGQCLADLSIPARLRESMNYSLLAGGKRLRPCLCLLCAGAVSGTEKEERDALYRRLLPFACALEMIHTYSLIHDDLPAMDDDDLRRGRPSNHKAFDEATAILAGDALLTDAFWFMTRAEGVHPDALLKAVAAVADAAGARGMVGGQMLDMEYTGLDAAQADKADLLEKLKIMQACKTGALFRAACVSGGILGGGSDVQIAALTEFAEAFGLEFQIVDDILDITQDTSTLGKPAGSDIEQGKMTWVSLTSLEDARTRANHEARRAADALHTLNGPDAQTLAALAIKLADRVK